MVNYSMVNYSMVNIRILLAISILTIMAVFSVQVVFASHFKFTDSRPSPRVASPITPGLLPTVKGQIQVKESSPTVHLNPDRPIRKITYDYAPRKSYRSGKLDYYDKAREARDQTRPEAPSGIVEMKGSAAQKFSKTHPSIYPYETGSRLRPGSAQGPYVRKVKTFGASKSATISSSGGEQ